MVLFFAVQNTTMVTVYFFVWQFSSSLALVLLLSLAIGVILSLLLSLPRIQSKNWQIIKLKKRINEQEKEKETIKEQIAEQLGTINSLQRQVNEYKDKLLVPPKVIVNSESIKANSEDEQTNLSK